MPQSTYLCPSSPSYTCLDRFSLHPDPNICEDENGHVPFWPILESLLNERITSAAALIDTLETISATLTGSTAPATDHHLLREAISEYSDFFPRIWPKLAATALAMPSLFPNHCLPILGRDSNKELILSRQQAACLVVHQFLRTLKAPGWRTDGTHDFGIWYSRSGQRQESAAKAYLKALMVFFDEVVSRLGSPDLKTWDIVYTLHQLDGLPPTDDNSTPLAEVQVVTVDEYNTDTRSLEVDADVEYSRTTPGSGFLKGAVVISANRYVGFGQSATQEEIHVGVSPEACPAVLVTPPLEDTQVLVVKGVQAMVNIVGQRREIMVEKMGVPLGGMESWKERTMLFMDALELDLVDDSGQEGGRTLPDLRAENIQRELVKAYTAFSSGGFNVVRTGLWGCGAFNGDPVVKFLILWLAASMAGVKLVVVCEKERKAVSNEMLDLSLRIKGLEGAGFRVDARVIDTLLRAAPATLVRNETASWFRDKVGKKVRE